MHQRQRNSAALPHLYAQLCCATAVQALQDSQRAHQETSVELDEIQEGLGGGVHVPAGQQQGNSGQGRVGRGGAGQEGQPHLSRDAGPPQDTCQIVLATACIPAATPPVYHSWPTGDRPTFSLP